MVTYGVVTTAEKMEITYSIEHERDKREDLI